MPGLGRGLEDALGPGLQGWPRSVCGPGQQPLLPSRRSPVLKAVPTLWRLSCFSTMWSLFSMAFFSLQSPGLGKSWGRE